MCLSCEPCCFRLSLTKSNNNIGMSEDFQEDLFSCSSQDCKLVPNPSGENEGAKLVLKAPSYPSLIRRAIKHLNCKTGSSKLAILRFILANYPSIKRKNAAAALKRNLKQMKKSGRILKHANGGYKLPPRGYQTKVKQKREELRKRMMQKRGKRKQRSSASSKIQRFSVGSSSKKYRSPTVSAKKKKICGRDRKSKQNKKSRNRRLRKLAKGQKKLSACEILSCF